MSRLPIEITCDGFPAGSLKLSEFRGHDELSRMFQFDVQVLHEDHEIAFDRFLGKAVTVKIPVRDSKAGAAKADAGANPKDEDRFFNGLVVNASYTGIQGRYGVMR